MILDLLRGAYQRQLAEDPWKLTPRGNPTGSRWGKCMAQSQMLLHPELSHPEPFPMRSRWVMDEGHWIEAGLKTELRALLDATPDNRREIETVGMEQQVFYFPVPLAGDQVERLAWRINGRKLWGTVRRHFEPPFIRLEGERVKVRTGNPKMGVVLDPVSGTAWLPTYVDWIAKHRNLETDALRLVLVEVKSLSNYAFRQAVLGTFDREKRWQLAGSSEATGLDCFWYCFRRETAHRAEVHYERGGLGTRVTVRLSNGIAESYLVPDDPGPVDRPMVLPAAKLEDGTPADLVPFPEEGTWDYVGAWTPFRPDVLEELRANVRQVLFYEPTDRDREPGSPGWSREYGPTFACGKCGGQGRRVCSSCKGSGVTAKLKKVCGAKGCQGGQTPCEPCESRGRLDEVELPKYPCGYCPVVRHCWPEVRLEVARRPMFYVRREAVEAAGIRWIVVEPSEEAAVAIAAAAAGTPTAGQGQLPLAPEAGREAEEEPEVPA